MIKKYLEDIYSTSKSGDATEPSYYPDLKKLLHSYLKERGIDPSITVQPKRLAVGIPDFTVRKSKELIGYVEAKDPKYENLDKLPERDQEQLKRYREKLPNLILTNFLDFRLYRDGKLIKQTRIGMPKMLSKRIAPPPPQNEDLLREILSLFFAYYIPEKRSPKALAEELAKRAQLLPQSIIEELTNDKTTEIDLIYSAFKEYLMSELRPKDFADIYAQTLTYGLFVARLNYKNKDFDRKKAGDYIPKSIKILRDTFKLISSDAIPESLESYVDDIATILAHSNIEEIKEQLKTKTGESDPIVHFYETFLGEYDPTKRKSRGVYYTPLPVVSYITHSVNNLLKEKFKLSNGLADSSVTLLDPAAGTLTFPAESIRVASKEQKRYSQSLSSIKSHFLKHFFAFEILMAPYIIGHLKMGLLFEELNIPLKEGERFPLYLTNSLDFSEVKQGNFPFVADLAEEAKQAKEIKEKDILVILGNPPYTSEKKEAGTLPDWIREKILDYAKGLGVEKEKKKGVLQDDYIRFIRFAHWKINHYGKGIVAFITNNSYLDGIIHRSMRKQLLDSFNEIYILNLHGNSRIGEKTPESGADENVFDIQQGVSIAIFVKSGEKEPAKIYYKDLWGLREEKNKYLLEHTASSKKLDLIEPQPNEYYFTKKDYSLKSKWDSWLGLDKIFSRYISGVETKRDDLVVDFNKEDLKNRIQGFSNAVGDDNFIQQSFGLSAKSDLSVDKAILELKKIDIGREIVTYSYRPFDTRYLFYHDSLVSRTRGQLMKSLSESDEMSIVTVRQLRSNIWRHIMVAKGCIDATFLANITSEWSYVFPINAVPEMDSQQEELFSSPVKSTNLSHEFWDWFDANSLGSTTPPYDIFYYIYGVLYSKVYRDKYSEFLRSDFPHIPFTKDGDLFYRMSKHGEQLVDLHLLKSSKLDSVSIELFGDGDDKVEKREWSKNQVWINANQYFAPVSKEVWEYFIGGYQIADKWLKDRQGRNLGGDGDEVRTYCKLITSIVYTTLIQKNIDKTYKEIEAMLPKQK